MAQHTAHLFLQKVVLLFLHYLHCIEQDENDFISIQSMFVRDTHSDYKILEVSHSATDGEIKKAYRKMASKYHPDKVTHLGGDLQDLAEEKFKAVNDAYQSIKKDRGMS